MLSRPARAGEEFALHANEQDWLVSWHAPGLAPEGTRHGSAGICVTGAGEIVLVSHDGLRWDFPAGRPEGAESWEETLRREMWEEACASVESARLLGFTRGRRLRGKQEGEALVRAFWRADVVLAAWNARFEIGHRRLVPADEVLSHLQLPAAYLPIYLRALAEAALT